MSLFDYTDNPNRVAGPGELPTDLDYDGNLDDDCEAAMRTPNDVLRDAFLALKPEPLIGFNDGITIDGVRVGSPSTQEQA